MLRLTPEQLAAQDARVRGDLVRRLAGFLREEFDVSLARLGDGELVRLTGAAVDEARLGGLDSDQDVALYVYAKAAFGPAFPDQMEPLFEKVVNVALPFEARRDAVAAVLEGMGPAR